MSERDSKPEPKVSNSDLFALASRIAQSGLTVEYRKTSDIQFIGTYNEGSQTHSVALSYSRVVGGEIVRIFSNDTIDFSIQHVDQPNTSALDEYRLKAQAGKFPQNILEILESLKLDYAAMNVFEEFNLTHSRQRLR